jgi:hypothetical protein
MSNRIVGHYRLDWARQASTALIQPCWILIGIASDPEPESGWDLARPPSGPLAWVLRTAGFRGNKAALPSKPCAGCGLVMSWRRRWAKNWADVKYCSDACRRKKAPHG